MVHTVDHAFSGTSDTTAAVLEFVSALFVDTPGKAAACVRLLKSAGIPARMDAEVAGCVAVLVPDDELDLATEILAKRKKDVEEEEEFDEEEDEDDELDDDEDEDDEDEEFDEEDFEEEFEDDELDEDDDIFYDDDDDE